LRQALPGTWPATVALGTALTVSPLAAHAESIFADNTPLLLEEIVVTIQRRQEDLQDVPVSALVISEPTRIQQNIESLPDLTETVPSVHVGPNGRSNDLYIRGIGSGVNSSFDQSVGMFIDDIYHGRSRSTAATFLDLSRVEILKGPQSTFFGNNAIAGAFNLVTTQPTQDFDASARALYGQYGQYTVESAMGGPILTDVISARAAVTFNGLDGWLKNISSGEHSPKDNNAAARVTLRFTPGENWSVLLKGEGSRNRNEGAFPDQIVNCPPPAPFATAGFCKAALGLGVPVGLANNLTDSSPGQQVTLNTVEDVMRVEYHSNQGYVVTSISGYYNYQYNLNLDPDATPASLFHAQVPERYHQFSQELRVASPVSRPIEYVAGLYYQTDQLYNRTSSNFFFLSPVIQSNAKLAPLTPYLPLGQNIDVAQTERSYAAFASITWNITDSLSITPSIRGSWVDRDFNGNLLYGTATQPYGGVVSLPASVVPLATALGLGVPRTTQLTRSDNARLPSAKLQYQLGEDAMTYLSYSRGFKAGGFNGADTTGVLSNIPYAPEHVNAYEAGLKSKWLDKTLLTNFDVFRMDYTDLQVAALRQLSAGTFANVVNNAATSRSQGAELEAQWILARSFRLGVEATYLNAYYIDYPVASPTALQQLAGLKIQSLSGRPTEYAPHTSGSINGTFSPTLPGGYRVEAEAIAHFSTSYYLSGVDDDLLRQRTYTRLDARLSLGSPTGRWNVDVIGKNLTDRKILVFATPMATSLGSVLEEKEAPANVSVQVRLHW
jgi:outer membrane receptor protein involved in Fe transport